MFDTIKRLRDRTFGVMAEGVEIRRVRMSDQEPLGALWLAFLNEQAGLDGRVQVSDDALDRWRNEFPSWVDRDRRHILVAEKEGRHVGFITAVRHAPPPVFAYVSEVYVEELYVAPEMRRQGVGRALFEAITNWAESWGAQRVRLSVLTANESGRGFWSSLGLTDLSVTMAATLSGAETETFREKGRIGFGA